MCLAPFEVIVFTNKYAGNFERELCAYVTGMWDLETHGEVQAAVFNDEVGEPNPFEEYVTVQIDEHGLNSPNCIERDYLGSYTGVGIYFNKKPTPALIELIKERAHKFCKDGLIFGNPVEKGELKILTFKLREITVTVGEEEL